MSVSRVYGVLVSRGQRGVFQRRLKYWTIGKYNQDEYFSLTLRHCSSKSNDRVNLGDVSKPIIEPEKIELVPIKYLSANKSQAILRHLRWMMQKDVLGQDMFLIGFPGPLRRQIAMMYLEMTKREVEYISLSRDTTESDLKQRREILAGTALYVDQCAIEAAVKGRVLVLEGIEKAERNVLPVLNNLLENREMQLDDGKFLVAASRYDQLLKDHTKEELDELNLVRVNENFRVIALGLPVPRYKGNPLDPPLRSRFQARGIQALPFKEHLEILEEAGKNIPSNRISQMLSFASTMLTDESASLGLPDFPIDNLHTAVTILNSNPNLSMQDALQRVYPYKMMLTKEGIKAVEDAMKKFELLSDKKKVFSATKVEKKDNIATVHLKSGTFSKYDLQVPAGNLDPAQLKSGNKFVKTAYHDNVIAEMFESHAAKDFCLIGPKGCGKSILVQNLADTLGYNIEPIHLHQDMTSRDLLQQRMTHPNGDTSWTPSPLVSAALNGNLAVLDGIHRINHGSFSVLHRLIHDRELHLYDGTRLLRQDRYAEIKNSTGKTDTDLEESKIFPIHPSFRIIALAEPPVVGSSKQQWLTPEILTMFLYHNIRLLSLAEEEQVLKNLVPNCPDMTRLLDIVQKLRSSSDSTVLSLSSSLSTRQLLRIARRQARFPSEDLSSVIEKSCLARFLPKMARSALEQCLEESGIEKKTSDVIEDIETAITCEVKDGMVKIRNTSVPVFKPENLTKVPNILFYENPQHLAVMEDMLKDYSLGEHLLLVGNQGVGKNKIVDRFLQLLNRPREYLQLHRDTTVQTLTLQPTVQGGVITYEDSPLVRAVKEGNVLVIDEADKAPTQVTCILKTLVESGEMHMADGRRIVSANSALPPSANVIVAHPDFRMIVLANRPGFPFLGNDFFAAMGDIFSCHAIDNPDADSEMAMLRQYGPDVPDTTLKKLVMAFAELRDMADQGLIAYPYSTREVVNMVKHLQEFPLEGLSTIVRNVFDFDSYNNELRETIIDVMKKHGIPLGADHANVRLSKEFPLAEFQKVGHWKVAPLSSRKRGDMFSCPVLTDAINIKGPVQFPQENVTLDRHETRSSMFTELESQWLLPLDEGNVVADLAVTKSVNFPGQAKADMIHVATSNPIAVYSMSEKSVKAKLMDLYNLFPSVGMSYRPKVKLVPLLSPLDDTIILHEAHTNAVMSINYVTGEVARLKSRFLPEVTVERRHFLRYGTKTKSEKDFEMLSSTIPGTNIVTLYEKEGDSIVLLDPLQGICHQITVPMNICNMVLVDTNKWILTDSESNQKYNFTWSDVETFQLQPIHEENVVIENRISYASTRSLDDNTLNKALQQQISCPNRLLVTPKMDAVIILGYPELEYSTNEIYMLPRDGQNEESPSYMPKPPKVSSNAVEPVVVLPESGQIIRAIETEKVPKSAQIARDDLLNASAFMEIIDVVNQKKRYVRVPSSGRSPPYAFWLIQPMKPTFFMAGLSNDGLVTIDSAGCVQLWETSLLHLERSLQEWRNMIGYEDTRPLQINYERESGKDVDGPKHGKIDPDNVPHVGGNMWAGGTGGRDTAGLGGFGGPYRLDAGHDVYQVPQHEKDAVPEEIKRAAREMAEKAFKERLREIQMSEYDAETYESFAKSVRRQIHSLRVIIDSLQAKGKERQWLKHQTYGDLDDTKLIEGITGEKTIYKRRGEQEPELGTPQELPKKLRLVVDVSGSMYRFNGHDGRLEREMSAVLMVMEALEGYENKFKYEIFGHSGESYDTNLVKADKVPKNNKERLTVLKTMHAHSQFCLSGDHTLEATKHSISSILKDEADEYFVIILSDANFDRYGIRPQSFAKLLTENEEVNAFAIFIGSLGDQAVRLTKQLPMGRAFVCMDTDKLPQILQQIFTSTMLSSS